MDEELFDVDSLLGLPQGVEQQQQVDNGDADMPWQFLAEDLDAGMDYCTVVDNGILVAQVVPKGEGKEKEEKRQKEEPVQETNAERCRRQRQKRKEREEALYRDNRQLKQERSDFLKQISNLQYEIQTFRGTGAVDLSMENELLKAEIRKHKKYIETVLSVTKNIALETSSEENMRLLRSGIESGIGQLVGLAYSSASDPSWTEAMRINLKAGGTVRFWYQFLPLGLPREQAKRISIRFEHGIINGSADEMFRRYWEMYSDEDYMRKIFDCITDNGILNEIVPPTSVDKDTVRFYRIVKDDATAEQILSLAGRTLDIYPSAFMDVDDDRSDMTHAIPARVVCKTCANVVQQGGKWSRKDKKGLDPLHFGGLIVRPHTENSCKVTFLSSLPFDAEITQQLASVNVEAKNLVDEKGVVNPALIMYFERFFNKLGLPT